MQLNSSMFQLSCFKREKNIYKGKGKLQECQTEDLKGCSKCSMPECSVQRFKRLSYARTTGRQGWGWVVVGVNDVATVSRSTQPNLCNLAQPCTLQTHLHKLAQPDNVHQRPSRLHPPPMSSHHAFLSFSSSLNSCC